MRDRKEIMTDIGVNLDRYCEGCSVNKIVYGNQVNQFCWSQCKIGYKLLALGDELEDLGRSKAKQKRKKEVLMKRNKHELTKKKYQELKASTSYSDYEIAEIYQIATATLYNWKVKWGLAGKNRKSKPSSSVEPKKEVEKLDSNQSKVPVKPAKAQELEDIHPRRISAPSQAASPQSWQKPTPQFVSKPDKQSITADQVIREAVRDLKEMEAYYVGNLFNSLWIWKQDGNPAALKRAQGYINQIIEQTE
ncbi:zinc-finger domain-containing protein [Geomicrobium sediminis]|uniref:Zinc-finger domain-containing protein n=1 Tax=Geomicrobium sediminis TaxID=1347788 RepID=A0ABS2P6U5_9BACL|nr:zinc-finger domain-containing protein [Geomicrobium sediminis]MBM7631117.1 hypothetical protein [Geomicrobium sediminis]